MKVGRFATSLIIASGLSFGLANAQNCVDTGKVCALKKDSINLLFFEKKKEFKWIRRNISEQTEKTAVENAREKLEKLRTESGSLGRVIIDSSLSQIAKKSMEMQVKKDMIGHVITDKNSECVCVNYLFSDDEKTIESQGKELLDALWNSHAHREILSANTGEMKVGISIVCSNEISGEKTYSTRVAISIVMERERVKRENSDTARDCQKKLFSAQNEILQRQREETGLKRNK